MNRTILVLAISGILTLSGAFASPQQGDPTERMPNHNTVNRFPRWLTYTRIDPDLNPGQPGQNPWQPGVFSNMLASSVAIDSRNVAHIVGIRFIAPDSYAVTYYNNRFDTRRSNGFSPQYNIAVYSPGTELTIPVLPDVWVDSQDEVHVAWQVRHVFANPASEYDDIWYARKTAAGWVPPIGISPVVFNNTTRDSWGPPQIQTTVGGGAPQIRVVASFRRDSFVPDGSGGWMPDPNPANSFGQVRYYNGAAWEGIPNSPLGGLTLVHFALDSTDSPWTVWGIVGAISWSRRVGPGWQPAQGFGGPESNWYPDIAIDSTDMPHVVWASTDNGQNPPPVPGSIGLQYQQGLVAPGWQEQIFDSGVIPLDARLLVDSRRNVHVLFQLAYDDPDNIDGIANGYGLGYAAWIRNQDPPIGPPGKRFTQAGLAAAPVHEQYDLIHPNGPQTAFEEDVFGTGNVPDILGAAISKNDVLHLVNARYYTRTQEYGLGSRDGAALQPVLPGGAVNLASGNLLYGLPIFGTSGVGPTQSVSLVYNSLESYGGLIAPGWKLNYEIYLVDHWQALNNPNGNYTDQPQEIVTLFLGDGRPVPFRFRSFGAGPSKCYLAADDEYGCFSKLERFLPGQTGDPWATLSPEYRLTDKSNVVYTFNSAGKLREIKDPVGDYIQFDYDSGGLLTDIKDISGTRDTLLTYENGSDQLHSPRILTIRDPALRMYTLDYGMTPHLLSVEFTSGPSQPTYTFDYYAANSSANRERINLPSMIHTPRATVGGYGWTIRYLQDNRLVEVQDPQEKYLLENQENNVAPGFHDAKIGIAYLEGPPYNQDFTQDRETRVTHRRTQPMVFSQVTRFKVDAGKFLVKEIIDPLVGTNGIVSTQRTFDGYGNLLSSRDRWNFTTFYTYYSRGANPSQSHVADNLAEIFRPSTGGPQLVATYTYTNDLFNRVNTVSTYATPTEGAGLATRVTTNGYDGFGRLLSTMFPDVTRPDGVQQQNVTVTYQYAGSNLFRITNEEGHSTTFTNYHPVHGLPQTMGRDGDGDYDFQTWATEYDSMGNLTKTTPPQGNPSNDSAGPTEMIRDELYRVIQIKDPLNNVTTYAYDVDSNQTSVAPAAGDPSSTSYDRRGFVSGGTSPDGTAPNFAWSQVVDANGNVRVSTNLRGYSTGSKFDLLDRVLETTRPGGSGGAGGGGSDMVTQYVHDGPLLTSKVTEIGSPNRETTTTYDSRRRPVRMDMPDGTYSESFYDEQDQLIATQSTKNGILSCSVTFRDARDRADHVRTQNGAFGGSSTKTSTSWSLFNKVGSVVKAVDPNGDVGSASDAHKTTYVLDQRERLHQVKDGFGVVVTENSYGGDDLVFETKVCNPETKSTALISSMRYSYTKRKEQKTSKTINNATTTTEYGTLHGQVTQVTDPGNRIRKTTYYSDTQHVDTMVTAFGTSAASQVKSIWTNGLLTRMQVYNPATASYNANYDRDHDQADRLENCAAPLVSAEITTYTEFSEVFTSTIGSKNVIYVYDNMGRNTSRQWGGAFTDTITLQFDNAGLQSRIDDGNLRRDMTYDSWQGTPIRETFRVAGGVFKFQDHSYDVASNYTGLSDPEAIGHEWIVDANNRVSQIKYLGVLVSSVTYTPGGLLDTSTQYSASGSAIVITTHFYDTLGRQVGQKTVRVGGATVADLAWEYDILNRVTKYKQQHLGLESTYAYDERDQLTEENNGGGNNGGNTVPPYTNQYGGPAEGNESDPSEEVQIVPQAVLAVPAHHAIYAYDPAGNRTQQTIDGVTTVLTYNAASQLTLEDTSSQNKLVEHEYDEWGNETRRVTTVTVNSVATVTEELYGYNYLNVMSSYVALVQVGSGQPVETANWLYDFWPTGDRYRKFDQQAASGEHYVPRNGDVVTEYNNGMVLTNSYVQGTGVDSKTTRIPTTGSRKHYIGDMVGTVCMTLLDTGITSETSVMNAWGVQIAGNTSSERYGYSQRELDTESSLVFMRHRMYDPARGRFTQTDPIVENRPVRGYGYATNNPILMKDPTGLWEEGGHFYTTYMVAVAAGHPKDTAFKWAYYSQLPDEKEEFEAFPQALAYFEDLALADQFPTAETQKYRKDINSILHSLYGGEPTARRASLKKMVTEAKDPIEKGLLIHAFGDSYAHTHSAAIPGISSQFNPMKEIAYGWPFGHLWDLHRPDKVELHKEKYCLYVDELFNALGGDKTKVEQWAKLESIKALVKGFPEGIDGNDKLRWLAKTKTFQYDWDYDPLKSPREIIDPKDPKYKAFQIDNLSVEWMRKFMDRMEGQFK